MSDTAQAEAHPDLTSRGVGVMISYKELVEIRTQMATMTAMLQAALALQGTVNSLAERVRKLELKDAKDQGASGVTQSMKVFIAGVVTTAIGGGALNYLPILWGGLPLVH